MENGGKIKIHWGRGGGEIRSTEMDERKRDEEGWFEGAIRGEKYGGGSELLGSERFSENQQRFLQSMME